MQRWRILPPPGQSGSPSPGGGWYRPVKTAALSELPFTPDTLFLPKQSIGDMLLSPSGFGVDDNLTVDGHNEVDARSRGCSHILALSARHRCIIILEEFYGWTASGKKRGCRCGVSARLVAIDGIVTTAEDESRSRLPRRGTWRQYDRSAK